MGNVDLMKTLLIAMFLSWPVPATLPCGKSHPRAWFTERNTMDCDDVIQSTMALWHNVRSAMQYSII